MAGRTQNSTKTLTLGETLKGVFGLVYLVICVGIIGCITWVVWSPDGADKSQSAPPTAAQLTDAKYLSDRYGLLADTACAGGADDYLRSVARYDYAWDHVGALDTKFDHYSLIVKKPGVLTVISDKAKLQNGFGAFEHVTLSCDFDTQADYARNPASTVLGYSIQSPNN